MALSREEIEQIAEATAQKVVAKSKGNPVKEPMYSQCGCGTATTNILSAIYHTLKDYEERKQITRMHEDTLGWALLSLEYGCPADMAEVADIVNRIKKTSTISEKDFNDALKGLWTAFESCRKEATKE